MGFARVTVTPQQTISLHGCRCRNRIRGNRMEKLDKTIADVGYILDCLIALRNIIGSGCCNDCKAAKDCAYIPEWGMQVRYNCPFYERAE